MKTTIKRRAKSALAVVLTLCMVLSVFTIGIASAGAATVDSEGVGYTVTGGRVYFDASGLTVHNLQVAVIGTDTNDWDRDCLHVDTMTKVTNTDSIYTATVNKGSKLNNPWYIRIIDTDPAWSDYNDTTCNDCSGINSNITSKAKWYSNTYGADFASGSTKYITKASASKGANLTISTTNPFKTSQTIGVLPSNTGNKVNQQYYKWDGTSAISSNADVTTSKTVTDAAKTSSVTLTATAAAGYVFDAYYSSDSTFNDSTKLSSSSTYTYTATADNTVYAKFIPRLTTPSITATDVNAGTAATLTVSNHSTIKSQNSGVTYVLKKGNTTLEENTDYTFDSSTGVFTLTDTTTDASGSYTVQAIANSSTTYTDSLVSSAATVNVYSPEYCLVGNDIRDGAITIGGTTPDRTAPTGTANYWNTWQENYAINTATGTPGVYRLTFTVKEEADYPWSVELGIMMKDVGQKAFILGASPNGDPYNTSQHGDFTVRDSGVQDSDNLYVYDLAAQNAGGALVLKHGQTYTITIDQTQRYDSSSPYGKITMTATDAYADAVAKKQDYDSTNRDWASVTDAEAVVGTASSSPLHGAKGSFSTTLTANLISDHYQFIGWYKDDPDCEGEPDISAASCTASNNDHTFTYTINNISTSAVYYAFFKHIQPSQYAVAITNPTGGTISLTGGVASTGTSATTAYQDATVSMSIALDRTKDFAGWKIISNKTGADVTSSLLKSNSTAASGSFTMPGYPVTVTADLTDKSPVTINVTSNNTDLGTADYSYTGGNTNAFIGEYVTITATPVGGVFKNWTATGAQITSTTSSTTTIKLTANTVTVRAVFEYKTYRLYSDKDTAGNSANAMYTLVRQDDGTYVSTRTVDTTTGSFTIYDVKEEKYAVPDTKDYEFNTGFTSRNNTSWSSSASTYKYKIKSGFSGKFYVVFDPNTGTYGNVSVTTTNPMGTIAQIYAKDGSIRYATEGNTSGALWENSTGGPTCNRGVTVITKINSSAVPNPDTSAYPSDGLSDHLKIYSAAIGSTITIQTTVNSSYNTQGFYVGMFVVNGWKVAASDMGNGVYAATYTLTSDKAVPNLAAHGSQSTFEITPVYYNKNFEYITFYVDAESVPSKWGETISTCADYNGATNAHFEGTYPGQPLGREGDLYEIKVARYYYDYSSSTGKWTKHPNYHPSATITAYNYDNVHHKYYVENDDTLNSGNNNYQTYDFSDFAYYAQIEDIEAILFRCKYETSKSSWQIYDKADSAANSNAKTPVWYFVDDKYSQFNTWHVLTDYYGNPIDALGNRIVKSGSGDSAVYYSAADVSSISFSANNTSQIHIVSYGNRKTDDDGANARTAAKWSTGWAVYKGGSTSGTNYQIAYGNPADFICTTPGTASTANVHYLNSKSASDLTGKLTFITYDKERKNQISGVGDTGERIDGQWYYSAQHDFDSDVKVAITTAPGTAITTSNTTIEVDSNSTNNTGYVGKTSGTKATLDGETTHTYSNVTTEAVLSSTVASGYTFVGWYIYDGSTYTKINDNFADHNTTMLMKKNYTIVAVVRVVPAGSLVITHSKYTGSSPTAHDGTGKYYVSAKVIHSDSTETLIAEAQNSIAVPGLLATDKLEIKVRTVCDGVDTFYAWYEEALGTNYARTGKYYEICDEDVDPLGLSEASYTFFYADCSAFFSGGSLQRKTIDLYSDIVHVSAFATLTYKYFDRFATSGSKSQMVSYVVKKVPLSNEEIAAGFIPSDETISKYAPTVVDTIYTDTKWTIAGSKVQRESSSVTLMATQTPKTCFVLYLPNDVVGSYLLQSATETPVNEVVAWNSRTVDYNSWLINADADMDNPQESDFYVSAPLSYTYNETTWNFVRFDVYSYDRTTGNTGEVIFSSNDNHFGYRIYSDCVIYPVYSTETLTPTLTAVIEPAVLNREVYGDSASATDKLYADLIVSYINAAAETGGAVPEEIRANTADTGYTIETGVILDKKVNLSDDDYAYIKGLAEAGEADITDNLINNETYVHSSDFTSRSTVENFAKTAAAGTGTGDSLYLTKYINNNNNLTNKNRLDKVFRYNNTEAAQKRVFAAYSYVVIRRTSDNEIVAWALSAQQRFNLCYVGNKPLESAS